MTLKNTTVNIYLYDYRYGFPSTSFTNAPLCLLHVNNAKLKQNKTSNSLLYYVVFTNNS